MKGHNQTILMHFSATFLKYVLYQYMLKQFFHEVAYVLPLRSGGKQGLFSIKKNMMKDFLNISTFSIHATAYYGF